MKFTYKLTQFVISSVIILSQLPLARALELSAINDIAKQITVHIDGSNQGTGVIVNKQGNTYTILTNYHVVEVQGKYTLRTPDEKMYNFNSSQVKKLPNLDLAIFHFVSNKNYNYAQLGDSDELNASTPIYNAGWAVNDGICLKGCYRFYSGIINGISPDTKDGFALIYNNNILPGMSGGPVLNASGKLVGINGQSFTNFGSGAVDFAGIPINEYKKYQNSILVVRDNNQQSVSRFQTQREIPTEPFSQSFERYIWPAEGSLTSGYGWKWGRMHRGIDITNVTGTPIYASAGGVVETAGWSSGGKGNLVEIRHPDGSLTSYGHNSRILVQVRQKVDQGKIIAEMGTTGHSIGPHLHFELHIPGKGAINPIFYLPAIGNIRQNTQPNLGEYQDFSFNKKSGVK